MGTTCDESESRRTVEDQSWTTTALRVQVVRTHVLAPVLRLFPDAQVWRAVVAVVMRALQGVRSSGHFRLGPSMDTPSYLVVLRYPQ